jgi:GrpB-like predicted nucleotidyltransferase (UPF0157 family)
MCLLVGLWLAGPCAAATEMEQRAAVIGAAREAFLRSDFARLEQDANLYRTAKSRTASGLWKLTFFYLGLGEAVDTLAATPDPSVDQEAIYRTLLARTETWSRKYPDSPSACITRSMVHLAHAWAYRGTGYASTVKPEAWAPFYRQVALGRQALEACKRTAAVDPRWYQGMLFVARAEGWPREAFDRLFDEALEREPAYYQNYFTAMEFLLPQWHGSVEEIERFAREAERRSASREGRGMYTRIYWSAAQSTFENSLFTDSRVSWPHMKEGFEDIVARWPDDWNLNNFASFACMAQDKRTTRELLKRIGTRVVPEAWSPPDMRLYCAEWSAHD